MNSRELIHNYISEVRVKTPSSSEEVKSYLLNLHMNSKPHDSAIFKVYINKENDVIHIYLDKNSLLPGLKIFPNSIDVDTKEFDKILSRVHGWRVVSAINNANIKLDSKFFSYQNIELEIESLNRNNKVRKPTFLYHVAPVEMKNRILRKGLIPNKRDSHREFRYHEPRIYFFLTVPSEDQALLSDKDGPLVIFSINTKKFDRFNLYRDPSTEFEGIKSGYTLTHIPPSAIKVHGYFQ